MNQQPLVQPGVEELQTYSLGKCDPQRAAEIEAFLADENLTFLGFELEARVLQRYRARFPNEPTMTNLENWHVFELENPSTFAGMYQFWIQKRR